jgi:antitoxin component of RelBE/YafQ-DinJ toxin-antitoxin module
METTKSTKTVSAKLSSSEKNQLEQLAAEKGITVTQAIKNLIAEAKNETATPSTKELEEVPGSSNPQSIKLSDESLELIANVVSKVVVASTTKVENEAKVIVSPDREHLRKLAGLEPESDFVLSETEEKYLSTLKEAIKAQVRENFLLEENSVPVPMGNALQEKMYKEMIAKRNEVISDKVPKLQTVFEEAITKAFFEDCTSLWNKNLFKATYGITHSEFEAVFQK